MPRHRVVLYLGAVIQYNRVELRNERVNMRSNLRDSAPWVACKLASKRPSFLKQSKVSTVARPRELIDN